MSEISRNRGDIGGGSFQPGGGEHRPARPTYSSPNTATGAERPVVPRPVSPPGPTHERRSLPPADLDETEKRRAGLLERHIQTGIALIKEGAGEQAYRHFARHKFDPEGLDVEATVGTSFPIRHLLTEEDVVETASEVAGHSRAHGPQVAEIGGFIIGEPGPGGIVVSRPELYRPELVHRFHHEVSVVGAEEWLHMHQHTTRPGMSESEREVEVAAILQREGVPLSFDFLTRYPERAAWYVSHHPEREEEIVAFAQKYGRNLLIPGQEK